MKLLEGKKGIVFGVLNNRSIAWGIAKDLYDNGAEFIMSYSSEAAEKRIKPLAEELNCDIVEKCDVTIDEDVEHLFKVAEEKFGKLDFIVHAIAFSDKNELRGRFSDTTRDNFKNTMDISCCSINEKGWRWKYSSFKLFWC